MKIEIDHRPETAKFVVDGHALDVHSIEKDISAVLDTSDGLKVTIVFRPEQLTWTDMAGVTTVAKADGTLTISGTDEKAVRRAAGLA